MSSTKAVEAVSIGSITQSDVSTYTDQLTTMATMIGDGREPMTPIQRAHTPRARTKAISALPTLLRLATEQGLDAAAITKLAAAKAYVDLLTPLAEKVDGLGRVLSDAILGLQSDIWGQACGLYVQLQGKARTNTILKEALVPLKTAFSAPRRSKQPAADTTSSDTATTADTKAEGAAQTAQKPQA